MRAATVSIAYFDGYPAHYNVPFMINIQQKQQATQLPHTRRFYNGLGELIQEQQARTVVASGGLSSTRDIVVDSATNPLVSGAEQLQSVAYELPAWETWLNMGPTPWRGHTFINQTPPYSRPHSKTTLDIAGRPLEVRGTDGQLQQRMAYSETQTQAWDAANHLTTSALNVWGQVTQVAPPTGPGTTYTYDPKGQLTGTQYGPAVSTITYDLAGRKVGMNDADMGTWSYGYDALGQLKQQTDARGKQLCFYYDELGRMTGKLYQNAGTCSPTPSQLAVQYFYDETANGNLGYGQRTSMTDSSGETKWRYDGRGRVIEEVRQVSAVSGSFKTIWSYNSADAVSAMAYPNGNSGQTGEVVTTNYRLHGAVLSVVGSDTYLSGAAYDAAGRMVSQQLANGGQKITQGYFPWTTPDGIGRLQTIQAGTNALPASFLSLSYTYDSRGNISRIIEATNAGQAQNFTYDALNRLATAATDALGAWEYSESYGYDANTGNLISKGGQTLAYANSAHPHAATSMGANSYGYDAVGNMTSRTVGGVTYTLGYDHENRLTAVTGGSTIENYLYDGDGARRVVYSGYTTTVYIGDYYEYTVVDEPGLPPTPDPTGGGEGAPSGEGGSPTISTRSYYYAGSQRLAVRDSATGVAYLYGDHLGSASIAVGSNGSAPVLSSTRYKPWGEQRGQSGSSFPTDRLFTGQIWDGAESAGGTGLYFYNARYYDPALGRFTQADTIVPSNKHSGATSLDADNILLDLVVSYNETDILSQRAKRRLRLAAYSVRLNVNSA